METRIKDRVILGIDPGTIVMGYGILRIEGNKPKLEAMGVLQLNKYEDHYLRLRKIFERVTGLIDHYHPDELAKSRCRLPETETRPKSRLPGCYNVFSTFPNRSCFHNLMRPMDLPPLCATISRPTSQRKKKSIPAGKTSSPKIRIKCIELFICLIRKTNCCYQPSLPSLFPLYPGWKGKSRCLLPVLRCR